MDICIFFFFFVDALLADLSKRQAAGTAVGRYKIQTSTVYIWVTGNNARTNVNKAAYEMHEDKTLPSFLIPLLQIRTADLTWSRSAD